MCELLCKHVFEKYFCVYYNTPFIVVKVFSISLYMLVNWQYNQL